MKLSIADFVRSIAYGVIAGILSYIVINGVVWLFKVGTGGRVLPPTYGHAEAWVIPPGGIIPMDMSANLEDIAQVCVPTPRICGLHLVRRGVNAQCPRRYVSHISTMYRRIV